MNLYKEARDLAQEALDNCEGDFDAARDFIYQSCDGDAVAIYLSQGYSILRRSRHARRRSMA